MTLTLQAKPAVPVFNPADLMAFGIVMALPCVSIGGGTTPDITPFNNFATIQGGVTVFNDPTLGNVLQLDGTTGYLALRAAINAALDGQTAASVSFWLRLRNDVAVDTAHAGLADLTGFSGPVAASLWAAPGNLADVAVFRGLTRVSGISLGTSLAFPTSGIVNKTQWHLVTITTVNGGNYTVWLNGNIVSQTSAEGVVSALLAPTAGRSSDGGGFYFLDGWIGDLRIWNRELQLYEVRSQVNNPWGLYLPGAPPGQVDSIITEIAGSKSSVRQANMRTFAVNVLARPYPQAGAKSLDTELASTLGALPSIPSGRDPRIKPAAPVLQVADPVVAGLQLVIPFYEGSGATAHDKSGNAFDDNLSNPTQWTTGTFRSGTFSFDAYRGNTPVLAPALAASDAQGSFATVPRNAALEPAAFTIAAWVTPSVNQASRAIFAKPTGVGPVGADFSYFIGTSPAGNSFQGRLSDAIDDPNFIVGSAQTFDGHHPYHVAFSYDPAELPSGIMRLYVNGQLDASLPDSGAVVYDPSANVLIGNNGTNEFNGAIDLVSLWNRKLSDAEILLLAGGANNEGGMDGLFATGAVYPNFLLEAAGTQYPQQAGVQSVIVELAGTSVPFDATVRTLFVELAGIDAPQNLAGLMFSSIAPNNGPQNGSTAVTIKGIHFENITQVLVGGTPLTSLVVVDQFTITGVTGAHAPGLVDVEIDSTTRSYIIAKNAFDYTGTFGGPAGAYIRGKQIDPTMPRQPTFTGITAVQGVDTLLPFTLSDLPQSAGGVKVYLDNSGTQAGGRLMRQGTDYSVVLSTGQVMWLHTAAVGINPSDVLTVLFLAQGNN